MAWSKYLILVLAALFSGCVTASLVPVTRRLALRWSIVDLPGERKIHAQPVPLLGGAAILAGILVSLGFGFLALRMLGAFPELLQYFPSYVDWRARLPFVQTKLVSVLLGTLAVFLLGLIDDLRKGQLDYRSKFPVQFAIAGTVVLLGVRTQFMPGQLLDVLVSVVWIVGITNAFNLLDNMDGLTAGVSAISGSAFAIITASQNQDYMAFLLALIVGSSLGFLPYNFHPARIFMGDAGSLSLGFLFGTSTILASYVDVRSPTFAPVLIPVLVLSVPLFDSLSVMYIRWREKRPLFVGDRRHFSHRLVDAGLSERGAVLFIYLVNAGVAMGAILLPRLTWAGCLVGFLQTLILYGLLTILMVSSRTQSKQLARRDES